jgi:repressor LexA
MLTAKQKEALDFIDHATKSAGGVSPSHAEIRDALGLNSTSGVDRLVCALEERGFIRRIKHKARGIEVIRRPLRVKYFKFDDDAKELKMITTG